MPDPENILFETESSIAESAATRRTVLDFLAVLRDSGYTLTPPVPVGQGDETVHFVNATSTPFKRVVAEGAEVGRLCHYQPCFRAHGERPWLFAFGMAGLLADADDDATFDEVVDDAHRATLAAVPDGRVDRVHVLVDERDEDLLRAVGAAADRHGGTVHALADSRVSTRWDYGDGYPQRGRGVTYYYRRPAVGCDEACRPDCPCPRWQPLSNSIVVESGARRYVEVGFGVEITAAIPHGANCFALPEIDDRVQHGLAAGLSPGDAADAVNLFRGVALLEESQVPAAAKGAGSVVRTFQGRLLDLLGRADDGLALLGAWGASAGLRDQLERERERRDAARERNLRAATRALQRDGRMSAAQLRATFGLEPDQVRSLRPHHRLPRRLQPGGTVSVVSPSWQGASVFPERARRGLDDLASWSGLRVQVGPHDPALPPGSREARADQLNRALRDPDVDGVLWMIGGVAASALLDLVDCEAFAADPKVLCGYSDATVLHHALYARTGAVTFYGPAVLSELAETGGTLDLTRESFLDVTMRGWSGFFPRSEVVYEEFVDWAGEDRPREAVPAPERRQLRPGTGSGPLLPGCLQSAVQLIGTAWLPDYAGHVLALEPADDGGYGPAEAAKDLRHLQQAGLLEHLEGLVLGRPRRWSEDDRRSWEASVLEVCHGTSYPIVSEVEFGHTDPVLTLPVGHPVQLSGVELSMPTPAVR